MNSDPTNLSTSDTGPVSRKKRRQLNFSEDFWRFFMRGLAALLPTLVTLWLLVWVWNFLWHPDWASTRIVGVGLSLVLVYVVGVFVGNYIGRAAWRAAEVGVLRIPLVRAIYPAVKQVTDFVLSERSSQFQQSRVVAVQPHEKGIWSIGLVTGPGVKTLSDAVGTEMVTVFIPSTPTAFTGYVLVVPRSELVELPLKVEEAMRLLVSGGVISAPEEMPFAIPPLRPS